MAARERARAVRGRPVARGADRETEHGAQQAASAEHRADRQTGPVQRMQIKREIDDQRALGAGLNEAQGILMRGTATYNASSGALSDMSAYVWNGTVSTTGTGANAGIDDNANWIPATFSTDGYPQTNVSFVPGVTQTLQLEMGLRSAGGTWNTGGSTTVAGITGTGGTITTGTVRRSYPRTMSCPP
mgnify:CR=1 FL=1